MAWTSIGVDLGGTKALAVRVRDGVVVDQARFEMADGDDGISSKAIAAVRRVWTDDTDSVGVGVAGLVRWPEGVFVWGPHVAGTDVPLRDDLEATFGVPAVVDNDANMAALAEVQLGAARGHKTAVVVTLGTGIGGALVVDGRVQRGRSFAGEWGHIQIEPDGLPCDCGRRGCWETVASGPALVRLAGEVVASDPEGPFAEMFASASNPGEAITAAAAAGDETARQLVARVGAELGRGLTSLISILDPEVIVVGGGLGSVGELLLDPAREVVADSIHGGAHRVAPPIVAAELGGAANAIGAALMAYAGDAGARVDADPAAVRP